MKFFLATLIFAAAISPSRALFFSGKWQEKMDKAAEAMAKGDYSGACGRYDELISQNPPAKTAKLAYFGYGQCLEKKGEPDKALGIYHIGARIYPSYAPVKIAMGSIYYSAGMYKEGIKVLGEVVEDEEDNIEARILLARCYERIGHLAGAARHYEYVLHADEYPHSSVIWGGYGLCLLKMGRAADAEKAFRQALAGMENNPDVWLWLAVSVFEQGRTKEALNLLSGAEALAPSMTGIRLRKAFWLISDKRPGEAVETAKAILSTDQLDSGARLALALAFYSMGDKKRAAEEFEMASGSWEPCFSSQIAARFLGAINNGSPAGNSDAPPKQIP